MAANGTWLCPPELDRARLLDMEARIARPRALMYAALGVAFVSAIPWIGWWTVIPLVIQVTITLREGRDVAERERGVLADAAPYEAKRAGRDRVVAYGEEARTSLAGTQDRRRAA